MVNNIETVGELVERLFKDGFMKHEYWFLIFRDNPNKSYSADNTSTRALLLDAISKGNHVPEGKESPYFEELKTARNQSEKTFNEYEIVITKELTTLKERRLYSEKIEELEKDTSNFEGISKKKVRKKLKADSKTEAKELADQFKDENRKYFLPPLSPFDLFAITSTFLLKSGAYHHFEAALEDISFDSRTRTRDPVKTSFVRCNQISNWRAISKNWYNYNLSSIKQKENDPFSGLEGENHMGYGGDSKIPHPKNIIQYWAVILDNWDEPIYAPIKDTDPAPKWWDAAYSLMAISDEASKNVGFKRYKNNDQSDTDSQKPLLNALTSCWTHLAEMIITRITERHSDDLDYSFIFKYVESISLAERSFVNVMPKSKTALLGCTLRSLSHNLANLPGNGLIRSGWAWASSPTDKIKQNPVFNMLLIPYPYEIHSTNFKPTAISQNNADDCDDASALRWGAFSLDVKQNKTEDEEFIDFVSRLIREASKRVGSVHAIVLPELALSKESIVRLRKRVINYHPSIELICSGVREHLNKIGTDTKEPIAVNGAYMASIDSCDTKNPIQHEFFHEKHHRWRITEPQITDYGLSPTLDPSRVWWEDIRVVNRRLPFLVMRDEWSITTLICEDLARNDPAKTVVESIGPNLVISLLMDGPQTERRWPARYATVLADDPGSSVLSMSSFGLIKRSNKVHSKRGFDPSNSFALWRDDRGKSVEIELDEGNHASVISLNVHRVTDYTMDGRADNRTVALRLTGQRQIRDDKTDGYPPWGSTVHVE
ncbi:MAG: hypothetical protein ACI9SP_000739 [Arenicella sp.]|jgi:hypothetical protein